MTEPTHIVEARGPKWFRTSLGIVGAIYLAAIFLGSAGSKIPREVLPRTALYFTQVACLFPSAATHTIDYRASGYSCATGQFEELDHRAYFPIHPHDKENRYARVAFFYRRERQVMEALEEYLVDGHNARVVAGENTGDGIDGLIGGIRVTSLRIPLPEPGTKTERFTALPLEEVSEDWIKHWFWTPASRRELHCSEGAR